jgi:hypothetical protein
VARTLLVTPSPGEQALYAGLSDLLREQYRQGAGITRMVVQTLQMELGSSPRAAVPTLERLLAREVWTAPVRDGLDHFLAEALRITDEGKSQALLRLLAAWPEKLLIFTATGPPRITWPASWKLRGAVCYHHGGLRRQERRRRAGLRGALPDPALHRGGRRGTQSSIRPRPRELRSAMEPHADRAAHRRLSRVGQTQDVHVFNLVAPGTIEESLLAMLDTKINMFELVIGEIDMILGELSADQDFEELVTDLWLSAEDRDDFRLKMDRLGDQLLQAKRSYLEVKALEDRIFGDSLAPKVAQ